MTTTGSNIDKIVDILAGADQSGLDDLIAGHFHRIEQGKTGPAWKMAEEQRRDLITAAAAIGCTHMDDNQIALLLQTVCLELAHSWERQS